MRTLDGPRPHPQHDLSHLLPVPRYAHMMAFAKKNLTSSTCPVWHKPRSPVPIMDSGMPPDPLRWVHSTHKLVYGDTRGASLVASVPKRKSKRNDGEV